MRPARIARVLLQAVGSVVLVVSGVYLLVYLYRWEWNRAMISGLFFVAAEVALVGSAMLRRVGRLERRLDDLGRATVTPTPEGDTTEGPFAWLRTDGAEVFVPVLLGIGVVLSAFAYVIERIAGLTAGVTGEAGAGRRLRRLDSVAGGPALEGAEASVAFVPPPERTVRAGRAAAWVIVALVSAALLATAINVLAELTQYRPEPGPVGGRSTYDLVIELRDDSGGETSIARALWLSCSSNVTSGATARIVAAGDGHVTLTVAPQVAKNDDRRFTGCLEDAQLDHVIVDVVGGTGAGEGEA